ncbi:MAG: molybdenum cofactor biosynthesis protein B [Wenzhouxiangellaceae bacterium]
MSGLAIALLTVSDTRTAENDRSGDWLAAASERAGHHLAARTLVVDNRYRIRATVAQWIADEAIQVVLITGGTGFRPRDVTPEAVTPLLDQSIPGFGELFRQISYQEIGSSTIQSRALAGVANNTLVFCLPGSTNACSTAWNGILREQLNRDHKPCNFADLLSPKHD